MGEDVISTVRDYLGSDKATYEWVQTFADNLQMDNFIKELGTATDFAHALCGLFALFYVCRIVWRSWANGSQLDIYKCLKPFVIGMCIMSFPTIVAGVDFFTESIGKATQQFSSACSEKSNEQFITYIKSISDSNLLKSEKDGVKDFDEEAFYEAANIPVEPNVQESTEEKDIEQSTGSKIVAFLGDLTAFNLFNTIKLSVGTVVTQLLQSVTVLLASIIACCILCMGFIGRCIFYFFGPFLFAMELIPGMEGRISGWFKKYLTYSLYPCIINIVSGVLVMLMVTLSDMFLKSDFHAEHSFLIMNAASRTHFIVSLIGAFMFMSIPSVANQLMDTAANSLGGSGLVPVTYAAGKAGDKIATGQKLGSIGKTATSVISGGAGALVNTVKGLGSIAKKMSSDSNMKGGDKK